MKKLVAAFLVFSILVCNCSINSFAKSEDSIDTNDDMSIYEQFIGINSDGELFVSDKNQKKIEKKYGKDVLNQLEFSLNQSNDLVRSGYIKFDNGLDVVFTEKLINEVELLNTATEIKSTNTLQLKSTTGGINDFEIHWWGFRVKLDSTNANRLAGGYGIGWALASFIPEPLISKVVGALAGVTASVILIANASGNGIVMDFRHSLPVPKLTAIYSQ